MYIIPIEITTAELAKLQALGLTVGKILAMLEPRGDGAFYQQWLTLCDVIKRAEGRK